ncbi:hypothetical protein DA718_17760 [Klebsiella huaxiensis]|uniref:Uncharacterized protein n=1 Tax=Klebsiella huaxiensis TaxID=2153354 RepID=A0ABT6EBN9_9ENTR|nr:hypothetical protein [Klebsiella huaxiensis]MDG1642590.1 hypothetical protein [Klebsiella huaxiensis]QBG08897.1 hypothetical protein DA718_17760 [Klebsiella huaxiensis]VUT06795.1 hypothetical protein SB6421_04862 [Klebsiella huaxiensis]
MNKKDVYLEIYRCSLQHIRNVSKLSLWGRFRDKSVYYESQLIHKFCFLLRGEVFNDADIDFLNWGARYYYEECDIKKSIIYNEQLRRFSILFSLVPETMKSQLTWKGPGNV